MKKWILFLVPVLLFGMASCTKEKEEHIHEHNWNEEKIVTKEPTCVEEGEAIVSCNDCHKKKTIVLDALGHDFEYYEEKLSTCTENGWNEYITCKRCHYTTFKEKKCTGHSLIHHSKKEPTCEDNGWEEYDTCKNCSYSTFQELPALGHEMSLEKEADDYAHWNPCKRTGCTYCVRIPHNFIEVEKMGDVVHEKCECGLDAYRLNVEDASGWNKPNERMSSKISPYNQSTWNISSLPGGEYSIHLNALMYSYTHGDRCWYNMCRNDKRTGNEADNLGEDPWRYWISLDKNKAIYPTNDETWKECGLESIDLNGDYHYVEIIQSLEIDQVSQFHLWHGNIKYYLYISNVRLIKKYKNRDFSPRKITYSNGNHGYGKSYTHEIDKYQSFSIDSCNFTPEDGYVFSYWEDEKSFEHYSPNDTIVATKDMTLIAKWKSINGSIIAESGENIIYFPNSKNGSYTNGYLYVRKKTINLTYTVVNNIVTFLYDNNYYSFAFDENNEIEYLSVAGEKFTTKKKEYHPKYVINSRKMGSDFSDSITKSTQTNPFSSSDFSLEFRMVRGNNSSNHIQFAPDGYICAPANYGYLEYILFSSETSTIYFTVEGSKNGTTWTQIKPSGSNYYDLHEYTSFKISNHSNKIIDTNFLSIGYSSNHTARAIWENDLSYHMQNLIGEALPYCDAFDQITSPIDYMLSYPTEDGIKNFIYFEDYSNLIKEYDDTLLKNHFTFESYFIYNNEKLALYQKQMENDSFLESIQYFV